MARKGIHDPIYCYLPAHITVCQRHRRWIGLPVHVLDDQVDLHDRPQVLSAARAHLRLARQYSEIDLRDSLSDARHILVFWAHAERQIAAGILPEPVWPKLLCDRINERTGAWHSDLTPVEQWVRHQPLITRAS